LRAVYSPSAWLGRDGVVDVIGGRRLARWLAGHAGLQGAWPKR